jgi:hypothetical protein
MHLSYMELADWSHGNENFQMSDDVKDIDKEIFYSRPTSFFVIDQRIPATIRELITEGEGCLKLNYLTGASACIRKAIYELLVREEVRGGDYGSRIKALKQKYPDTDPVLFDVISHIQELTSDKVHEQSWPKWDTATIILLIETLKAILQDVYVLPVVKAERTKEILDLKAKVKRDKSTSGGQE